MGKRLWLVPENDAVAPHQLRVLMIDGSIKLIDAVCRPRVTNMSRNRGGVAAYTNAEDGIVPPLKAHGVDLSQLAVVQVWGEKGCVHIWEPSAGELDRAYAAAGLPVGAELPQLNRTATEMPVYELPVSELMLPLRAWSAVRKIGATTIGDLTRPGTGARLLSIKGFGKTSFNDVVEAMARFGLCLDEPVDVPEPEPEPVAIAPEPKSIAPDAEASMNSVPMSDLVLPVRARRTLLKLGIASVGELRRTCPKTLLRGHNFGNISLQRINSAICWLASRRGVIGPVTVGDRA